MMVGLSNDDNENNNNNDDDDDNDEILQQLREKYLTKDSTMPQYFQQTIPSKSELYDDEELNSLLQLHQELYPTAQEEGEEEGQYQTDEEEQKIQEELSTAGFPPGIHDMVLEVVDQIDTVTESTKVDKHESSTNDDAWIPDSVKERIPEITVIASDVDGTLIGKDKKIHPRTKDAIQKAVQSAFSPIGKLQYFFPATGKSRTGAMNSLGPEIASIVSQCPGVFIQGLYCVLGDKVIFEKKLGAEAIAAAEKLAEASQTSVIAYDGDNLYTTKMTQFVIDVPERFGEPRPIEIPSLSGYTPGFHKVLLCDVDLDKLAEVRVQLETLASEYSSTVTQAIPTMLELLPEGCSKAYGVEQVCQAIGVDPTKQLLALGDAENDVEMLQMASIGVAVGNGSKLAKDAADVVLKETNDEGGAGLAIETFGGLL